MSQNLVFKVCCGCKRLVPFKTSYVVFGPSIFIKGRNSIPAYIAHELSGATRECNCGTRVEF